MATDVSEEDRQLESLIHYVRTQRGFDFNGYKRTSLRRRIQRRMDDAKVATIPEYIARLEQHPEEFSYLFDSVLINVTSFFRDAETWQFLADTALPELLRRRSDRGPLRAWTAGCATGEEAYSVAILLHQALGDDQFRARVKIYATDADDDALTTARAGRFPLKRIEESPRPDLLLDYFELEGNQATFRKDLRRAIVFGRHDLMADPPISRVDLLTCRNTLMYFTADAQVQVLRQLHFALRRTGLLVLGKSEALATRTALFSPFDLKRRIFSPAGETRASLADDRPHDPPEEALVAEPNESDLREIGYEASQTAQVLIDAEGRLVGANQQARAIFGIRLDDIGKPLQDLEFSYRPFELRSRLDAVWADRRPLVERNVPWTQGTEECRFDVFMTPLVSSTGDSRGTSVSFVDVSYARRLQRDLEQSHGELDTAYEELQSTVEELETTNEELQSTNEELETTNEELQSTNEELETINEELQSTNEELETINDELRNSTRELDSVNAFLEAVLSSLNSAVVGVNREMEVQVWNPHAVDLWGLRPDEVQGEHLMNLDIGLPLEVLRQPIRGTLAGEPPQDDLLVDGVNRRGRAITCRVRMNPLYGDGEIIGAILLMEGETAAPTGST